MKHDVFLFSVSRFSCTLESCCKFEPLWKAHSLVKNKYFSLIYLFIYSVCTGVDKPQHNYRTQLAKICPLLSLRTYSK